MTQIAPILAGDEWRRYGSILPACFAGMMLLTVHSYSLGAMISPLEKEFGWTRAEISFGPFIPSVAAIVLAPLVGIGIDRLGPRRIALLGVPFFCAALALLSTTTGEVCSWWALYGLLGLASMFIFATVWTSAINIRFDRNRGLALAIALSGTGLSSALAPLLATRLTQEYGWRGGYIGLALISFVVVFPLVYLLFDRDKMHDKLVTSREISRVRLAQFLAPSFLKLAGAAFVYSTAMSVVGFNLVPILLDEGFSAISAAEIAGLMGIGTIAGRFVGGMLLDRFDARIVAAGSVLAPMLSASLFLATDSSELGALVACLFLGFAAGAEFDACAYLAARHFGMGHFGKLYGLIGGLSLFGGGIAPVMGNYVYDLVKSYELVLWGVMPAFALAGALFLLLGRYPVLPGDENLVPKRDLGIEPLIDRAVK